MKFKDVELLPGVVTNVKDPKMQGRIKATVPGLFDSATMNEEGLPWIYPLTMIGYQGFSKMMAGSKIWVFKTTDNYREFWYIPMFEMNANTKQIVNNYTEPDILISRSAGEESIYIYYNDVDGIKLQIGDSFINICKDKTILVKAGISHIRINKDGNINIGKEETDFEPTVMGNALYNTLSKLAQDLQSVASTAAGNVVDIIRSPLSTAASNLSNGIKDIRAENVYVN